MPPPDGYGQAEPGRMQLLDELAFDYGGTADGRAEAPQMVILPALEGDAGEPIGGGKLHGPFTLKVPLTDEQKSWPIEIPPGGGVLLGPFKGHVGSPALLLTIRPPVGFDADRIAADFKDFFAALAAVEAELGGTGLKFKLTAGADGAMVWRVTPKLILGAADRMRQLAEMLNAPELPAALVEPYRQVAPIYQPNAVAVAA